MKKSLMLFISIIFMYNGFCQKPIIWTCIIGGSKNEFLKGIEQTRDSGYIVIVETNSKDGDASGNTQKSALITKIDHLGKKSWVKLLPDNSHLFDYLIINDGILISYGIDQKGHDQIYFLSLLNNDGSVKWIKETFVKGTTLYNPVLGDAIFQINDTSFISIFYSNYLSSSKPFKLTYFNLKGEINAEKSLMPVHGYGEMAYLGNMKIDKTQDKEFYVAYLSYSVTVSGNLTNYTYFSNIIFFDDQGNTLSSQHKDGAFLDLFKTKSDELLIVRALGDYAYSFVNVVTDILLSFVFKGNQDVLVDKFSSKGTVLFDSVSTVLHKRGKIIAIENLSQFLTNDERLLTSDGFVVKVIDKTGNGTTLFQDISNSKKNLAQDSNGDFYVQTNVVNKDEAGNIISDKIKIIRIDNSGKVIWEKDFWNIKNGKVVSFYDTGSGKILIISKKDGFKEPSLYTVASFDNTGEIYNPLFVSGPSELGTIKNTYDGGLIIAGTINLKNNSISDYHGGSDIMIIKLEMTRE